jgi:DNA-binding beta-propeller fold protein YncE
MAHFESRRRKLRRLQWLLLQLGVLSIAAGCGGGYDDDDAPSPAPAPQIAEAQFVDEAIEGLGVSIPNVLESRTDAAGKFPFAVGRTMRFFVGEGANRLVVGSAAPAATASGVAAFSLHDLQEVQADTSDAYLANLVNLLALLDADADLANGIRLDAAGQAAVAQALAGGKSVNFGQAPGAFDKDPVVAAIGNALGRKLIDFDALLAQFSTLFRQSRSSTIALTADDRRTVIVNREKDSVSVIRVRNDDGSDANELLGEVKVGREPRFVALSPDDRRAYVTNAIDGTLSVIDLTGATPLVVGPAVNVGVEPRAVAVTPNGAYALVARHTSGDVAVVRLSTLEVLGAVKTGGNPFAIAITNDGDRNDLDERVFVTRLFGEVVDPSRPDGFDDAKQGVIDTFRVGEAVAGTAKATQLLLRPMASGFAADRRPFCLATRKALQDSSAVKFFNSGANGAGDGASQLAQPTFCPDVNSTDASADGPIAKNPQKVYPNMLFAALVRGSQLYVPNVGASPEPPVRFNVNVQGLVGVIDRVKGVETDRSLNLNAQIAKEKQPAVADETTTLDRVFLNDLVAMDADRRGRDFLFVSRGANYVLRASIGADGKLSVLDAANRALRFQTGNLPSGVVMSRDRKRAYTNNEVNTSITAIDLEKNLVLARDIESSAPAAPGSAEHRRLLGKLAFFTALGLPDVLDENGDGAFDVALRGVDPLKHRNKAADNGWSSCASCHEDGHSDNVTWIFETGPRQTIPLEGTFARNDLSDHRILNWSGVRGSNTDFNNNARGIQGGKGFATDVRGEDRTARVFNHGPTQGISDSLDALSEWVATIRAPIMPDLVAAQEAAGRTVFANHCASCHGGAKWTKSRTSPLYVNDRTFPEDPIGPGFFAGVKPLDAGVAAAGPQIVSVTRDGRGTLKLLDNVGTFSAASPLELRGAAAVAGQSTQGFGAFGGLGFNTPSLLGVAYSAPYLHDGSALTLEDVAAKHLLPAGGKSIAATLSAQELADVLAFVRAIDDQTQKLESDADRFLK